MASADDARLDELKAELASLLARLEEIENEIAATRERMVLGA